MSTASSPTSSPKRPGGATWSWSAAPILALDPADKADAHYRLALALRNAGDRVEAKSEVLKALEIAPNFEDALELLLELRRDGG